MTDLNKPSLRSSLHEVQEKMLRIINYASAVAPLLKDTPENLPELADSVVVLVVARFDAFLQSVVSLGARHKEKTLRKHFRKHGHEQALTWDLPELVKAVRRRVSFDDDAKRLDNLFRLMFRCSVWPSPPVRDTILDLVLLRNMIVHAQGSDWSEDGKTEASYAPQFRTADVLDRHVYGTFTVYSVAPYKTLLFVRDAVLQMVEQLKYLEGRLVTDMTWVDPVDKTSTA